MADSRSKSVVEIVLDDSKAQQAVESLLQQLTRAQSAASALFPSTGGGATTSTAPGGGGGGGATTSTAPGGTGGSARPGAPGAPSGGTAAAEDARRAKDAQRATAADGRRQRADELAHRAATFGSATGMLSQGAALFGGGSPAVGAELLSRGAMHGSSLLQRHWLRGQHAQLFRGGATGGLPVAPGGLGGAAAGEGAAGGEALGGAGGIGGRAALAGAAGLAAVAAVAGVVAVGLHQRYSMAQRGAALERTVEIAGRTGGTYVGLRSDAMQSAAEAGYGPEEAASTLASYYQQIGVRGAGSFAVSPFASMLAGVDPGALAAYQRAPTAAGMAANAGTLPHALGLARTLGISGGQTTALLQRIASASDQMLSQGMRLDRGGVIELGAALGRASSRFGGTFGVDAAARLSSMAGGAAQGLTGQLGGIADAMLQAEAFSGSDSFLGGIERLQEMAADPRAVRNVLNAQGPELGQLAFLGKGFSAAQARVLSGPLPSGAVVPDFGEGRAGTLGQAVARGEQALLGAGINEVSSKMLIEGVAGLNKGVVDFSAKFDAFTLGVLDLLSRFAR